MDDYAAHKHAEVNEWLKANPRISVHFIPTHASWMNMVEMIFGMAQCQVIGTGAFLSVHEPTTTIRHFIDNYNKTCKPFTWTRPANQILKKAKRPTTSKTRH